MSTDKKKSLLDQGCLITSLIVNAVPESVKRIRVGKSPDKITEALVHWHGYLGILMLELGLGICELAKQDMPRAMSVLNRSIFEYAEKSSYFVKHPTEALIQYESIPIRFRHTKSRIDGDFSQNTDTSYAAWLEQNPEINIFSGNKGLLQMHLSNTDVKDHIKDPNKKSDYTLMYQAMHDLPSLVVHGEPALIPDVFPDRQNVDYEPTEILEVQVRSSIFLTVRELAKTHISVINFLLNLNRSFSVEIPELAYLSSEMIKWRELSDKIDTTKWKS